MPSSKKLTDPANKPVTTKEKREQERTQLFMSAFAEIETRRLKQAENTIRLKQLRLDRDAERALAQAQAKASKKTK